MPNLIPSWRRYRAMWQDEGTRIAARIFWRKLLLLLRRYVLRQSVIKHYVPAIGAYMYINLEDSGFSRTIFYRGVHEPLVTRLIQQEVEPGMHVLDIGANMGYYVLLESRRVGPEGQVYALEPVPQTFEMLRENVRLNHLQNVRLFQLALGARNGQATMYVMEKWNWSHLAHDRWTSTRLAHMRTQALKTEQVPIRTLDRFAQEAGIPQVNFIRMDVEGFEVDIVEGGIDILARWALSCPIKIFLEVHPFLSDDRTPFLNMVRMLHDAGYRVRYVVYREDIVAQYPVLNEVLQFLSISQFREAPHLLLTNE